MVSKMLVKKMLSFCEMVKPYIRRCISLEVLRCLIIATIAYSLYGCATSRHSDELSFINIIVETSEQINPDANKRSSPVEMHVYLLKAVSGFMHHDYYNLVDNPEQVLQQDLLVKKRIFVTPGNTHSQRFLVEGDYAFVGVVASFRDLDGSNWRDIAKRPEKGVVSSIVPERWKINKEEWFVKFHVDERSVNTSGQIQ